MKCSPDYRKSGRQDVGNRSCDETCFHWKACLKELGLKDNYILREWIEKPATKSDIKKKKYHIKLIEVNGRKIETKAKWVIANSRKIKRNS